MKAKKNTKISKVTPFKVICLIGLIIYCAFIFFLLYFMISMSFKSPFPGVNYYDKNVLGLPKIFDFTQYQVALRNFKVTIETAQRNVYLGEMLVYSVIYAVGCALVQTLSCMIVGYATGRFNMFFNKIIYGFVIIAMTLPLVGSTPSQISLMSAMGIYDTWFGIFVSRFYFISVYYMVFSATFSSIPKTYTEAAKIDGASNFTVMVRIIFPLVRVTFVTIFLLIFVACWNDYSTPLLFLKSYPNVALGLYYVASRPSNIDRAGEPPVQMAAVTLSMIPVVIMFLLFRKQLIGNISMGGLKE